MGFDKKELTDKLNIIKNKNEHIINHFRGKSETNNDILTINEIKLTINPIFNKYGIFEIYLFGSYARGEANSNSDIDIYCEHGNVKSLYDVYDLNEELKMALNKNVDIIFKDSILEKSFEDNMKHDLIKLY